MTKVPVNKHTTWGASVAGVILLEVLLSHPVNIRILYGVQRYVIRECVCVSLLQFTKTLPDLCVNTSFPLAHSNSPVPFCYLNGHDVLLYTYSTSLCSATNLTVASITSNHGDLYTSSVTHHRPFIPREIPTTQYYNLCFGFVYQTPHHPVPFQSTPCAQIMPAPIRRIKIYPHYAKKKSTLQKKIQSTNLSICCKTLHQVSLHTNHDTWEN